MTLAETTGAKKLVSCSRSVGIVCDGVQGHADDCRSYIGRKGHQKNEFAKFRRAPGSLKVFSSIKNSSACNQQRDRIILSECCCDKGPRIEYGELRNEGEVLGKATEGEVAREVGDGDDDQKDEESAGHGWYIDAELHHGIRHASVPFVPVSRSVCTLP